MNFMMKFFDLLRDALWRNDSDIFFQLKELSDDELPHILALAEKQAVSGLIIDSLFRHDIRMPQQWVFEGVGILEQIKQQNRIINNGAANLETLMSEDGINYVIVKGQIVASRYPDPLLRQSGDIDYYCDERNFPLAQKAIQKKWGIKSEREKSELHVHYEYHGVTYEGHFSLASLYNKKKNTYWQRLLDNDRGTVVDIESHKIKTLSPTLHALYIFIHLYSHLLALGVGLRQFCDLAVILHNCKEHIDISELRNHLYELGLERAYKACGSILVDQLGLPQQDLGYVLTDSDRNYGKKILDVVMYRGNMGHHNKLGGFTGWKHKIESLGIKLSHFVKFWPLAPRYTCGWLHHEIIRQTK